MEGEKRENRLEGDDGGMERLRLAKCEEMEGKKTRKDGEGRGMERKRA